MNTENTQSATNSNFTIYHAQQRQKTSSDKRNNQLVIGNMVYDTLVNEIDQTLNDKDFKGILTVKCDARNETEYLVFAAWFCLKTHTYLLMSLGQYSERSYHCDLETYRCSDCENHRMHVHLFPMQTKILANLRALLVSTHLSQANVLILKETVEPNTQHHYI